MRNIEPGLGGQPRPAPKGRGIDLRRSVRRSLRSGGDLAALRRRRRVERPRPVVLIGDVSVDGRFLARPGAVCLRGMSRAFRRVGVFCYGTRLIRLADALRVRDPDSASRKRRNGWWTGTAAPGSASS